MKTANNTHIKPGVKEVDLALKYMKKGQENYIPQDSFRKTTLKELEDFGLIESLPNGSYLITEKGIYAKQMGAFQYMEMKRSEEYLLKSTDILFPNSRSKFIETAFVLFLLLVLIILVTK